MSSTSNEYNNILKLRKKSFFETKLALINTSLEENQKKNYVLDEDLNNIQITLLCLIDNVSALNNYIYNSIEYLDLKLELEEEYSTTGCIKYIQVKVDDQNFPVNGNVNLVSYDLINGLIANKADKNHNHNNLYPRLINLTVNNNQLLSSKQYDLASGSHIHEQNLIIGLTGDINYISGVIRDSEDWSDLIEYLSSNIDNQNGDINYLSGKIDYHTHLTGDVDDLTDLITGLIKEHAKGGMSIGTIFYYPSLTPPDGAYLLNGQIISNCSGLYPIFWEWANNPSTGIRKITEEQYQQELSAYNMCGGFVVDTINNSIRLPKISNGFIEAVENNIGEFIPAGLPNITGSIGETFSGDPLSAIGVPLLSMDQKGALTYKVTNNPRLRTSNVYLDSNTGGKLYSLGFEASLSNPIYGNSDTVQPRSIGYSVCIQVYNVANNTSELDPSGIISQLQNKLDIDLINITSEGEQRIIDIVSSNIDFIISGEINYTNLLLDWNNVITLPSSSVINSVEINRVPFNGILEVDGGNETTGNYYLELFTFGLETKQIIINEYGQNPTQYEILAGLTDERSLHVAAGGTFHQGYPKKVYIPVFKDDYYFIRFNGNKLNYSALIPFKTINGSDSSTGSFPLPDWENRVPLITGSEGLRQHIDEPNDTYRPSAVIEDYGYIFSFFRTRTKGRYFVHLNNDLFLGQTAFDLQGNEHPLVINYPVKPGDIITISRCLGTEHLDSNPPIGTLTPPPWKYAVIYFVPLKMISNISGEIILTDPIFTANSGMFALTSQLFSKDYNDLTNKPTIPLSTSQLINNSGFLTNASLNGMLLDWDNLSGDLTINTNYENDTDKPGLLIYCLNDSAGLAAASSPDILTSGNNTSSFYMNGTNIYFNCNKHSKFLGFSNLYGTGVRLGYVYVPEGWNFMIYKNTALGSSYKIMFVPFK